MSRRHVHCTTAGRVVYNRKTHLMGLNDATRIIRSVLRTKREYQTPSRIFVEMRDESDAMVQAIIDEVSHYFGVANAGLAVDFAKFAVWSAGSTGLSPIIDKPSDANAPEEEIKT